MGYPWARSTRSGFPDRRTSTAWLCSSCRWSTGTSRRFPRTPRPPSPPRTSRAKCTWTSPPAPVRRPTEPAPDVLKRIDLAEFESRMRKIDALLAGIEEGKGRVGQLVKGDQLYRDTL